MVTSDTMTGMADWASFFSDFWHLAVAFALAAAIGWNREQEEHNTGIRAFPIVAMASCTFVMIASFHGSSADQSRVLQGLVAGIGFVGGGAIMKDGPNIRGTATAASVLSAAALGAAVALDKFGMALSLTILNLLALRALMPIKRKLDDRGMQREAKADRGN
jgi:putative Mg2+ transporter-C (MgtC) family protein